MSYNRLQALVWEIPRSPDFPRLADVPPWVLGPTAWSLSGSRGPFIHFAVSPPLERTIVQPLLVSYQSPVVYIICSSNGNYWESLDSTKSMIPRFVDSGNKYSDQSATPLPSPFGPDRGNKICVQIECDSQSWIRSGSRSGHCLTASASSA